MVAPPESGTESGAGTDDPTRPIPPQPDDDATPPPARPTPQPDLISDLSLEGPPTRDSLTDDLTLDDPVWVEAEPHLHPVEEPLRASRRLISKATQRRLTVLGVLALILAAVLLPAAGAVSTWWVEAVQLVDQHASYQVSHPGWSFPSRVVAGHLGSPKKEPLELGWLIGPDAELRTHLPLSDAPKHLIDAIIAAEDRDFMNHRGVNLLAMLRAASADVQDRGFSQGGSTLTMQLVRNLNQQREKTLLRKAREMVMAMAIDRHLGKDGVLGMYLDAPYLGQRGGLSVCGFEAAAEHYFGRHASQLSLAQAATLAAILPAPVRYAPDRAPAAAKERRDRVLHAMADKFHYDITAALAEPIETVPVQPLLDRHPAYLSLVRAWLEARYTPEALYGGGLVITAAIDLAMQEETEALFPDRTRFYETLLKKPPEPRLESAGVLLDVDSGRIRAVYGGSNMSATNFNRATQARRQGGSAFKPVLYALAMSLTREEPLEQSKSKVKIKPRFTAASIEPNAPRVFKTESGIWRPHNIGGEYSETVCLAQGLAWSQNIATASLLEDIGGPKALIDFAAKSGFDVRRFPVEPGLALGQAEVTVLEMAEFQATLANGGRRVVATPVLSVRDPSGRDRKPSIDVEPTSKLATPQGEPVLSREAASLTRELMRLVIELGTGGAVRGARGEIGYSGPAMGKTGTTDEEKDLWFVGATPRYAAAVWLGYDHPQRIGAAASDLAAPLWGWWLGRVSRFDGPPPPFPDEPKIVRRAICTVTGKLAGPTCPSIPAPFTPGTEPRVSCPLDHPPPSAEVAGEVHAARESLWKRLAREEEEAAAEAGFKAP